MINKLLSCLFPVLMITFSLNAEVSTDNIAPKYEEVKYIYPEELEWKPGPAPGIQISEMFGDPNQAELSFTVRVKFPAGYVGRVHRHTQDEYTTVISGSLNVGIGDVLEKEKAIFLPAGGAVGVPAQVPHYVWTEEETVIQLHSMGQKGTEYISQDNK